eukprot:Rhum_TRINITY_DN9613_c0_g1::Rhum_TRINITY_DN9613_c0_g1_i1::g.34357::m.34357
MSSNTTARQPSTKFAATPSATPSRTCRLDWINSSPVCVRKKPSTKPNPTLSSSDGFSGGSTSTMTPCSTCGSPPWPRPSSSSVSKICGIGTEAPPTPSGDAAPLAAPPVPAPDGEAPPCASSHRSSCASCPASPSPSDTLCDDRNCTRMSATSSAVKPASSRRSNPRGGSSPPAASPAPPPPPRGDPSGGGDAAPTAASPASAAGEEAAEAACCASGDTTQCTTSPDLMPVRTKWSDTTWPRQIGFTTKQTPIVCNSAATSCTAGKFSTACFSRATPRLSITTASFSPWLIVCSAAAMPAAASSPVVDGDGVRCRSRSFTSQKPLKVTRTFTRMRWGRRGPPVPVPPPPLPPPPPGELAESPDPSWPLIAGGRGEG